MKLLTKRFRNEPLTFLLRKYWKFAEGHRTMFVFGSIVSVISNLFIAAQPLVAAALVNEIQQNGFGIHNIKYLIFIASWIVILTFFYLSTRWVSDYILFMSSHYARINARRFLLTGVLGLGLAWHGDHESGDVIDKVNKSAGGVADSVKELKKVFKTSIKFITAFIAILYFNMLIGLAALIAVVLIFYLVTVFDRYLIPLYKRGNEIENKVIAKVFDIISNITSVVVLNVQEAVFSDIDKILNKTIPVEKKILALMETKWWIASFLFHTVIFAVLASYMYVELVAGRIVVAGSIAALFMYLVRLGDSFFESMMLYSSVVRLKAVIENAESIESDFCSDSFKKRNMSGWSQLNINDILFRYENSDDKNMHLNNVSIRLKKTERVALIGESGSGKTTFLKVLHGMYPKASATIGLDDKKLKETNFADIDLKTTLVPQEPELFSASIMENITLGLEYSDEEISRASKLAEFSTVVKQLPNGYNSIVNEKGVNLSGGQKQRLALARALLFAEDKEIILLDESTSSVDPENEVKIYKNVFDAFDNTTIVASIHKMNLLKYFDRIIIFEKGKVVDSGSFDELLERNEKFKRDWGEYIKQNG